MCHQPFTYCSYLPALVAVWLLAATDTLAYAGGPACACEELLARLNPGEIPSEMQLEQNPRGVLAGIDVGDRPIVSLAFIAYGRILAVAEAGPPSRDAGPAGRVLLYDLSGTKPRHMGQLDATTDGLVSMATHPHHPDFLVTGGGRWDQRLRSWQQTSNTWKPVMSVEPFSKWWLRAMAISPDGERLATVAGTDEGTLRLWDITEHSLEKHQTLAGIAWAPSAIAFSPNSQFVAAGTGSSHSHPNDGRILVWDLRANPPKIIADASAIQDNARPVDVTSLVFTTDDQLISADQEGHLRAWKLDPQVGLKPERMDDAHAGGVQSLQKTRDGKLLSSGHDGHVALWNSSTGKQLKRWDFESQSAITAMAPSGRHCAVGLNDGRVYILQTGERQ